MLRGEIIVMSEKGNKFVINAGKAAIEAVDKWHGGHDSSHVTVEFIAFYSGVTEKTTIILA
ncbi:cupin domain-containing protein [Microbulbifer celer]|uniref:Uncharacterized protein n=1 Tax=Microbulbifer celer TaxID=435905 RepID=A0ABW3UE43_9GAMM|nr:hypothetical protein [Microbulbifer celer]UFN59121.1 hypothetical protein LPW13_08830 [Microbulbifer celer]